MNSNMLLVASRAERVQLLRAQKDSALKIVRIRRMQVDVVQQGMHVLKRWRMADGGRWMAIVSMAMASVLSLIC
jgi:hypothetical protein